MQQLLVCFGKFLVQKSTTKVITALPHFANTLSNDISEWMDLNIPC